MPTTSAAQVWEIVGGADRGGVLVRDGRDLSSAQLPERLSFGASVEELELVDGRLRFRRLTGTGPLYGWISISAAGKTLAKPVARGPTPATAAPNPNVSPSRAAMAKAAAKPAAPAAKAQAGTPAPTDFSQADPLEAAKAWDAHMALLFGGRGMPQSPPSAVEPGRFGGSEVLDERAENFCLQTGRSGCVALPREALEWDDRECDIYFRTDGSFHARNTVGIFRKPLPSAEHHLRSSVPGRVSVTVPTIESRQVYHELLWLCFEAQDWPDKELVVIETYHEYPSVFMVQKAQEDSRVQFLSFKQEPEEDWSIGVKRNMAIHLSTGEFIAHFDDDDLYANNYLSLMLRDLRSDKQAKAVKLASWYTANVVAGTFWLCDPIRLSREQSLAQSNALVKCQLYGFGFSYIYRRSAALEMPFEDLSGGEDFKFVSQLLDSLGNHSVGLVDDIQGVCLHLQHLCNLSDTKVCKFKDISLEDVCKLEVAKSQAFTVYMHLAGLSGEPLSSELASVRSVLLTGSSTGWRVEIVEVKGKKYLLDQEGMVYDRNTLAHVGVFNPKTKEVETLLVYGAEDKKPTGPAAPQAAAAAAAPGPVVVDLTELDDVLGEPGGLDADGAGGTRADAKGPSATYSVDGSVAAAAEEPPQAAAAPRGGVDVWGLD